MSLSEVQEKVEAFERAEATLKAFMSANEEWVDTFFELVSERNTALSEATHALRGLDTSISGKYKYGGFSKSAPSKKKKYLLEKIPTSILMKFPSIIKSIDERKLKKLITDGSLSEDEVVEALDEYVTKPVVKSPAEFKVILTPPKE